MSEPLWIALIGSVQAIIVTIVTTFGVLFVKRLTAVRNDVAVVKTEVKNDHSINMREEITQGNQVTHRGLDRLWDTTAWLVTMAVENRTDITDNIERTGQPLTRRQRRLSTARPPLINTLDIPKGDPS